MAAATDFEVVDPPADSISTLAWAPNADYLAVGSWDNQVRVYEVGQNKMSQGRAMFSQEGPVLSVIWAKDGSKVFSAGVDKTARMHDLATNQSSTVAQHTETIRTVRWVDGANVLVTGSWDKTLKYWDLRSPTPALSVALPERVWALDVAYPLLVVGTADRQLAIFDLKSPDKPLRSVESPLKMQTRCIAALPGGMSYAVGSIEGRVAVQYLEESRRAASYTFRCHRQEPARSKILVHSVNALSVHPRYGTVSSAGSDGGVSIWDLDGKTRTKALDAAPAPVVTTDFNRDGSMLAYGVACDWHKGHSGMTPGHPNKVMVHLCKDEEVKPKPRRT